LFLFVCTHIRFAGRDIGRPQASGPAYREISSCSEPYGLQLYPHPKNCDQFYKCENGTLTLETCENGLLFDGEGGVHNYCKYYWNTNCGDRVYERQFENIKFVFLFNNFLIFLLILFNG
jgi:hypothetical protein